MNKNSFILSISFSVIVLSVYSQTAIWQIKPTDYDKIERLGRTLYIVQKNNKIGIVNEQGTILAPPENDNLGMFYEHKALITLQDSKGERIIGVLSDDETFHKFSNKFYTLNGQKFYSDGVLSVSDENGKVGYIDDKGNQILGFDGKYTKIKPFCEGYASVFKNKKYYLIDKSGTPVVFRFNGVGGVDGGTNVYNGIVYVWDTYEGKFYTFNVKRGGVCQKVKTPANVNSMDYLYRFSSITGADRNVPFKELKSAYNLGIKPTSEGGLYGYSTDNTTVLPKQFSSASQFEDGNAIVTLHGKTGVLKYIDGEAFKAEIKNSNHEFYNGKSVICRFNLTIPAIWDNANLRFEITDNNGNTYQASQAGDYSFSVHPTNTEKKSFFLNIYSEDLKLYETMLTYSFNKKTPCNICGKDISICKGKHSSTTKKDDDNLKNCPTCGKNLKECPVGGDHSKIIY